MADIIIDKVPQEYDLAYGKVIVSLFDDDVVPNIRMAIVLRDKDNNEIGELRQLANPTGYSHFDISSILKSYIEANPNLESTEELAVGDYEVFRYKIEAGYVPFNGSFVYQTEANNLYVLNGRKSYNEIDWDYDSYLPAISLQTGGAFGTYNQIDRFQKALTDYPFTQSTGGSISDGKPSWVLESTVVNKIPFRRGNDHTLSFINDWEPNPTVGSWTNGINGFKFAVYNGNTLLATQDLKNLTSNGGGPNEAYDDENQPTDQYKLISVQSGYSNTLIDTYPEATHYYIASATLAFDPTLASSYIVQSEVYRFDLTDGECNDFDNIEVSWVNSFGMIDYFDFQKRNDKNVNVTRKTYKQLDADWSSPTIEVNSYNRGERVYSQNVDTNYTANTRYLTDAESQYLENLYISPDVRVRFSGGDWQSVILTSNQYTEKTFRKDQMFQHQIAFKLANPTITQNG